MSEKNEYDLLCAKSLEEPEKFWGSQAKDLEWLKPPKKVMSESIDSSRVWFPDGETNLSYLCIDQHIKNGFGDETAIIYDSAVQNKVEKFTYNEVLDKVSRLAGGLQKLGVKKGDTVIIYMPMIPQAVFSMLACARIGAIHSVVFGGFAPNELALRIDDARPKVVISATVGIEVNKIIPYVPILKKAIEKASHKPEATILYDRKVENTPLSDISFVDYHKLQEESTPAAPVSLKADHPSYILYTSGTTGKPKGVVRDTGGYAVALNFSMKYIYGVKPGDVFWAASDVGWVVGHSYIVYAPMIYRATTVLYEGKPVKTPDPGAFWRVISQHKVNVMFTAPTAFRAIKKEDPSGKFLHKYDISTLRFQFLAGERCDESTLKWSQKRLKIPVVDHWWQTESGWPIASNFMGLEPHKTKTGSAGKAVPGYFLTIVDEKGREVGANQEGYVCLKPPMPPGFALTLWGNNERFVKSYFTRFKGYYFSGDSGYVDEDGYIFITGRVDDVINVAGHRLSTASMEEAIALHPAVAECAVVAKQDRLKGELPIAMVVLKPESQKEVDTIEQQLTQKVRESVGPIASLKEVVVVLRLPKTRSGKVLRRILRTLVNGKSYQVPSTIEDPAVIPEIVECLKKSN